MSDPPYMVTTADCALGFERYRRSLLPHYFVLSADGKLCTYSYCMGGCRKNNLLAATLSYCEQTTGNGPCQVYAFGGQVDPARAKELQRRLPQ